MILLLSAGALFGLAQTAPGKRYIVRLIVDAVNKGGQTKFTMGKIDGFIPFRIQLDSLAMGQPGSQWLRLEDILIQWSPVKLLKGQFLINELSAKRVEIGRPSKTQKKGKAIPGAGPTWIQAIDRFRFEHVAIKQFIIDESFSGERTVFRVEAALDASSSEDRWESWLHMEQTNASDAPIKINASFKRKAARLEVDVRMNDPDGRLGAEVLGIETPVFLTLKGEGPVKAWKGELRAEAAKIGEIRSQVGLKIQEPFGLTARGEIKLAAGLIPLPLRGWADPVTRFDLGARLSEKRNLSIDHLDLSSGSVSLDMSGAADLEKMSARGRLSLRCRDIRPLETLVNFNKTGGLTVEGHFSGAILQPQTNLFFKIGSLGTDSFRLNQVEGNVQVALLGPLGSVPMGVRLSGQGKLIGLRLKHAPSFPEGAFSWTLSAEGPVDRNIEIKEIGLEGKALSLRLSGRLNTVEPGATMDGSVNVRDLSPFAGILHIPIAGGTRLKVKMVGNARDHTFSARFDGKYSVPQDIHPSLRPLLGGEAGYAGHVVFDGQDRISLPDLRLDADGASLKGSASYHLSSGKVVGSYQLELPKIYRFSRLVKQDIRGFLTSQGVFANSPKGMDLQARAVGRDIIIEGKHLERLTASVQAEGLLTKSSGQIFLALIQAGNSVQGKADFQLEGLRLSLSKLSLQGAGAEITGKMALDLEHVLVDGELKGQCSDLLTISTLFDQKIGGSSQVRATMSSSRGNQEMAFDVDAFNVVSPLGKAEKVSLQGKLGDVFKAHRGDIRLQLRGGSMKKILLASMDMDFSGDMRRFRFTGKGKGHFGKTAFDLETSGLFADLFDGQEIVVDRLKGQYGKLPFALERPAMLKRSGKSLSLDPLAIKLATGSVMGKGKIGEGAVSLSFRFAGLPLTAMVINGIPNLEGTAEGDIRMEGSLGQPDVRAELRINDFFLRDSQIKDLPPGRLTAQATLIKGRLLADLTVQGLTAKPIKTGLELPMNLSLDPMAFSFPKDGELKGDFMGEGNLSRIAEIFGLHDHKMNGRITLTLMLRGYINAPQITGEGRIEEMSYENLRTGTLLKSPEVLFLFEKDKISIKDAHLTDGESGKIEAQGWLKILPNKGFPIRVVLKLDTARLLRNDNAMITMDGTMKLSGTLRGLRLEGRLQMANGEFRIPERMPPEIVQLDVEEIPRPGSEKSGETQSPRKASPPQNHSFKLDVSMESSGRIFVSGRGLTSEWKGALHAAGDASAPVVTGKLSLVRGHVDFLGKRFNLSRGLISFDGAVPFSPQLDMAADAQTKEITARLVLSGSVENPNIKLSSEPILPQDEILSRLLFNRSLANITPLQAIQIAQALNTLAGGRGFDFMGRTRKILGVDQFELTNLEDGKGETAVSAGKYLSDRVYMQVEKGLGRQSGKASVEWEATPNISVESKVGENAEAGIGVKWKWDY